MKHEDVWRAIDTLAAENGLSASGLAKRSGLDADDLQSVEAAHAGRTGALAKHRERGKGAGRNRRHRSKASPRWSPARERWPAAAAARTMSRRVPLIGLAQAGGEGYFDDGGYPVGGSWDEVSLPEIADPNAYALEISGESMEPVYRDGDLVIVSPSAPIRRGDRVVVRTADGEVMAKQLARRSARRVELKSLNPEHPDYSFDLAEVNWIHRIIWASQ